MSKADEQMPLEIWTDINGNATRTQFKGGVKYIRADEYDALREQNRVLREALREIALNDIDLMEARALAVTALTATSQEGQHE